MARAAISQWWLKNCADYSGFGLKRKGFLRRHAARRRLFRLPESWEGVETGVFSLLICIEIKILEWGKQAA